MAAIFAGVVGLLTYRAATKVDFSSRPNADHWGLQGFRQSIYYPVVAFLDGENPYDAPRYTQRYGSPFFPLYSPLTLVVHAPFGLLPFEAAALVYYLFTIVATLLLAGLTLRFCGLRTDAVAVLGVASLILLSRPGQMNLLLGQSAAQLVIGAHLALRNGQRRPWGAGLGLAVATLQPTLGLPLAFLMLWQRQWRAVLAGLGIAALLSAAAIARLATAAGGVMPWLRSVRATYVATQANPAASLSSSWCRIDLPAVIARATGWEPGAGAQLVICVALLSASAWCLHHLARCPDPSARRLSTMVTCLAVLVCAYHQAYDLLLLAVPLTALVTRGAGAAPSPLVRWLLVALLALPCVNYLAGAAAIERLHITGLAWRAVTSVNGLALLSALLISLRMALQQPAAPVRQQ
jgi:hypothetical protein